MRAWSASTAALGAWPPAGRRATRVIGSPVYETTMRAAFALLLAGLLATPFAAAGTPSRPEVNDKPGDAFYGGITRDDLDVLRVWFQRDGDDLLAEMAVWELQEPLKPRSIWILYFSTPGERYYFAMTTSANSTVGWAWSTYQGRTEPSDSNTCPVERDPYDLRPSRGQPNGEYVAGSPGYIKYRIPMKDVALATGDQLKDGFAITYGRTTDNCRQNVDVTGFGSLYTVPAKPNWLQKLVPGFEMPALLLAGVVALALLRRKK